jgi:hypothetical protein
VTQAVQQPAETPVASPPAPGRFVRFMAWWAYRSPRWLAPLAVLACVGGAAAYVTAHEPVDGASDATTCLLKFTTGFDCPGCGGTRAFYFLINANLPEAARHHLMLVFAVPFLIYAYVAWAGNRVFRWRLPQWQLTPRTLAFFLGAVGVFSVLRNLPWPPFTWFYV